VPAAGCTWSVAQSPQVPGSSILYDVQAIAPDDVWAVGSSGDVFSPDPLAEHWDGSAWSVVQTPNPIKNADDGNVLDAVGATGPDDVWAVGSHIRRAGANTTPLILHFDGSRWRRVPKPPGRFTEAELNGVVAIAPDDAWIVGDRVVDHPSAQIPMAFHWNGTAWSAVRVPNPPGEREDELTRVSASGPDDVWAVGQADERTTLTLHFDGHRWRTVRGPNPPGDARNVLTGVQVLSPDDVWAVGSGGAPTEGISEHWNGSSWQLVSMADKGRFVEMADITGQSDGSLWAVGLFQPSQPEYQTLAEQYDGTSWSISKTPDLDKGDQLESVASTGQDVWAVGVTAPGPDFQPSATLILHGC
jgi:hypothetical protein